MYQNYDDLTFDFQKEREGDLADMVGTGGTTTTQSGAEGLTLALVDVELHDVEAARLPQNYRMGRKIAAGRRTRGVGRSEPGRRNGRIDGGSPRLGYLR